MLDGYKHALLVIVGTLISCSLAHMKMTDPIPVGGTADDLKHPLGPDLSTYPCRSKYLRGPWGDPIPWTAGSEHSITISGGAPHNGGSCQFAISENNGGRFKVIKTIMSCGIYEQGFVSYKLSFTVPKETSNGNHLFAWIWHGKTGGSREVYMNCAYVNIREGGSGLVHLPNIWMGGDGRECKFPEEIYADIPNPGPVVERNPLPAGSVYGPPVCVGGSDPNGNGMGSYGVVQPFTPNPGGAAAGSNAGGGYGGGGSPDPAPAPGTDPAPQGASSEAAMNFKAVDPGHQHGGHSAGHAPAPAPAPVGGAPPPAYVVSLITVYSTLNGDPPAQPTVQAQGHAHGHNHGNPQATPTQAAGSPSNAAPGADPAGKPHHLELPTLARRTVALTMTATPIPTLTPSTTPAPTKIPMPSTTLQLIRKRAVQFWG